MNQLHMETAILSHILIDAVCTVLITALWVRNRGRFRGLEFWAAGFMGYFAAGLVMELRFITANPIAIVIGYSFFVGGSILLYMGLERFFDNRGPQIQNVIIWLIFVCVDAYFVVLNPRLDAHIASFSVATLLISGQAAWLVLRRAGEATRLTSRGLGVVYLVSCGINLTRILVFLTFSEPGNFFQSTAYETSQLILSQAVIMALALSLFLTVNHRLVEDLKRDITAREISQQAEHASASLFRQMFTEHSAIKLLIDPSTGSIVDANPAAAQFYGYPIEELLQMHLRQINTMNPIELEIAMQDIRHHRRNYFVVQHRLASGELRDVEIHSAPIQVDGRQLLHSIIHDISERRKMDQALRYRTNILEALNQVALDLINRHEMEDILQTLLLEISALLNARDISFDLVENDDTLVTYAVTSDQPLKRGDTMRRGEGGWLSWMAIDSGEPAVLDDYSTWEKRRPLYEGYPIHAIMIVPVHQRGRVIGAINLSRSEANRPFNNTDIFVAKQLAQMVALILDNAQVYSQLQSQLAESVQREAALQEAQAQVIEQQRTMVMINERESIARDLHDAVSQTIFSARLASEMLLRQPDRQTESFTRSLVNINRLMKSAFGELRLMLYELRTNALSDADLEAMLQNLVDSGLARTNANIAFESRAEVIILPATVKVVMYRITQEALNNAIKHADPKNIQIALEDNRVECKIVIQDDGKGFPVDRHESRSGQFGLSIMRERAMKAGLEFQISSSEKGTVVTTRWKKETP